MHWLKLLHPVLVLGSVAWLYAKNGWRAGYSIGAGAALPVEFGGRTATVREMRTQIGWPVWAMLEIPASRSLGFHVRPESRLRLRREIVSGIEAFDRAFWIDEGSESLVRLLREREPLHRHFLTLARWLVREQSRLSRVTCEGGRLAVEFSVRWVRDRPRMCQRVLAWLLELDRLLSARPDRALSAGPADRPAGG